MRDIRSFFPATLILLHATLITAPALAEDSPQLGFVTKLGIDLDVRSGGRIARDETPPGTVILPEAASPPGGGGSTVPQIQLRGGNAQANDPALDFIQSFPGFRPFRR
jgi:hypothetical protein